MIFKSIVKLGLGYLAAHLLLGKYDYLSLCDRINVGLMISYYRLAVAGVGIFGRVCP